MERQGKELITAGPLTDNQHLLVRDGSGAELQHQLPNQSMRRSVIVDRECPEIVEELDCLGSLEMEPSAATA
jgi:hypothetical protein